MKKEMISYLVYGVLTTVVNIVSYWIFTELFYVDYRVSTSIAWLFSVIFAFITNKMFVFNSKGFDLNTMVREFMSFMFFRILSYLIDLGMMIALVEWVQMNDMIAKILANVVVVIINYVASKYIIFRKAKYQ
ncbi:GtrA family protein [Bacillus sp. DNRA2]|uniref:GtrA family protein n=1 Tax=Bacillus sp. DNRA2 TaxID=2723053 RepID=UPI00145E5B57|nr:GtrA family protein [Bacillus sp. DNRA2]NMD68804.1 GtrA family protein [Bacillus sp. DNRA2]